MSILVALLLAAGTFWRRPKLSLHKERPYVERNAVNSPIPYVRLAARNGRLHRASHGTRVLVESHRANGGGEEIRLGSPPLGWMSAADQVDFAVVVFPDGERVVDLGVFQIMANASGGHQEWTFVLAHYLGIFEGRNILRANANGYTIRVIVGSNDGRARRYDVHLNWKPDHRTVPTAHGSEHNARELMASLQVALVRAP